MDPLATDKAPRSARITRRTAETEIELELCLDGCGRAEVQSGVGFLDHMLVLLARHAAFDLKLRAAGDVAVDDHHTVEDIGICLGQATRQALGEKVGIRRFGHCLLPMEESLASAAVDLSGRAFFVFQGELPAAKIGQFDSELVADFWHAFAQNALCNLHIIIHYGRNTHHVAEAVFKAAARALRMAVELDPRMPDVPSTKGAL